MSEPYRKKGSRYWWISPVQNGLQLPMSTGLTDYEEARRKLKQLEGDIAHGIPVSNEIPLMRELLESVRRDYKNKGRRSIKDLERRLNKHLLPALGHIRGVQLSDDEISRYIERRQEQKAKNATINRELVIIKRAFRLNRRKVPNPVMIEMLPEQNERVVSYTDEQLEWVIARANTLLRDILTVYSFTGWRKTSVFKLEWSQVDFTAGFIFLRADQTKNRKATKFPLITPLREMLEERRRQTEELQKSAGKIIKWVFHRKGRPVKSIRTAFENTRDKAGLPGHTIHDFRRTAVRTLHDLGYDVKTIMDMCGFKTDRMVYRYIGMTSEERLTAAGKDLEARRRNLTGITAAGKVHAKGRTE